MGIAKFSLRSSLLVLLTLTLPAALLACSEAADGTQTAAAQVSSTGGDGLGTGSGSSVNDTAMTLSPQNPAISVNAKVKFTVSGGTGPYTYTISSGGGTLTYVTATDGTVTAAKYFAGATAGTATIQVTDSLGATATSSVSVVDASSTVFQFSPLSPTVSAGGQVNFSTLNGTGPYTFWAADNGNEFSTNVFTAPAAAGTIQVYVQDATGAQATTVVTVTASTSNPVSNPTYSTVLSTTFSTLASYQSSCKSSTPVSDGCYSAIYRICRANGYGSGFGPVESSGNSVTLVCLGSGAGADLATSYPELKTYDSSCGSANPASLPCNYSIDRICQANGYVSGYGPEEHTGGTSATVGCVSADTATAVTSTFAELQIYQSACTSGDPHGMGCSSAINRYCANQGYVSGFGFQWYSSNSVGFVCTQ